MWNGSSAFDCFLLLPVASARSEVRWELMQSQPARARSKTWVNTPFSSTCAEVLVVQHVGSVGHRDIAQHADGDHLRSRCRVLSSPPIRSATCWLRVVMSPEAETSTNSGDRTSSRPYWSRRLMALDQLSSIFWNCWTSGEAVEVTAGVWSHRCRSRDSERSQTVAEKKHRKTNRKTNHTRTKTPNLR